MSLTTFFQYAYASELPLPPPKPGQNAADITRRGVSLALSLLHDPENMISLNPIVIKMESLPPDSPRTVDLSKLATEFNVDVDSSPEFKHFEITDKLNLLFGYTKDLVYRSALRNTIDGMESLTDPGSGVTIHAKWVVKASDRPGLLTLSEVDSIHCNLLLSFYIKSSLNSSHKTLHEAFRAKWIDAMEQ